MIIFVRDQKRKQEVNSMDKYTVMANVVTIGGIGLCLAIAQLPFWYSVATLVATGVGCTYLTNKSDK